ncbi:hypothetical protein NDU88_004866 [Pleurodeles waltl]|uniref:Uncharacterized protein n=1 Tax=Pleurodeles waltl TaxID=8319 RepID=A0AAV7NUZ1_PLEWA|nr:hypothetical protein NDU88_004866 [Pleurodeles waltl]
MPRRQQGERASILKERATARRQKMLKTGAARARPLKLVTEGAFKMHTNIPQDDSMSSLLGSKAYPMH